MNSPTLILMELDAMRKQQEHPHASVVPVSQELGYDNGTQWRCVACAAMRTTPEAFLRFDCVQPALEFGSGIQIEGHDK